VSNFQCTLQDGSGAEDNQHDCSEVFPLGQFLENANQVDAWKEITPAIACGERGGGGGGGGGGESWEEQRGGEEEKMEGKKREVSKEGR